MNGALMAQEMAEQPDRLRELTARHDAIVERVRSVTPAPLTGITIAARGSSDHAAIYGRYLLEAAARRPVALAAPSLHTLYGVDVDYRGQLVIAASQSGATPEIVRTLQSMQDAGGRGLAITNERGSPLAAAAAAAIELDLGDERAVPATKTVTGEFAAFAMIAAALGRVPFTRTQLDAIPDVVQAVLEDPDPALRAAESLAGASRLVVVARGFAFAAALEAALKLRETCSLFAEGHSAADLRHGPIAAVGSGVPVIAICVPGPAHADVMSLVEDLRAREAEVVVIGSHDGADVPIPADTAESLAAIAAVVRGQQIAHALALRLGYDPDAPAGLTKVTPT